MNNLIGDMRDRLSERFRGATKPLNGFRVTGNNTPRMPQSKIPKPKDRYDTPGRPSKTKKLPEPPSLERKKPRDIWGGWL